MAIKNNFLFTIQQLYQSCSLEKNASERIIKIQNYLEENQIVNHSLDTYQEKIFISLFLKKLLEQEHLLTVTERFLYLKKNSISVLLSQKKICPCFVSYLNDVNKILEALVQYYIEERLVALLSMEHFDNSFLDLADVQNFLFDTSSIPFDLLLGSNTFHNLFYQILAGKDFFFYDFMNRFSFEERERIEKIFKTFQQPKYENKVILLKKLLEEIPTSNHFTDDFISLLKNKIQLLNKKEQKKRIRKSTDYDYFESLV